MNLLQVRADLESFTSSLTSGTPVFVASNLVMNLQGVPENLRLTISLPVVNISFGISSSYHINVRVYMEEILLLRLGRNLLFLYWFCYFCANLFAQLAPESKTSQIAKLHKIFCVKETKLRIKQHFA